MQAPTHATTVIENLCHVQRHAGSGYLICHAASPLLPASWKGGVNCYDKTRVQLGVFNHLINVTAGSRLILLFRSKMPSIRNQPEFTKRNLIAVPTAPAAIRGRVLGVLCADNLTRISDRQRKTVAPASRSSGTSPVDEFWCIAPTVRNTS